MAFIKEVFDRTLSSSKRQLFFDINPKNPNHWFYKEILDMHMAKAAQYKDYGFNYGHFTILDNLSIGNAQLREILRTYNKMSLWYKRDILGLRVSPEGIIYDMFDDYNLYNDGEGPNLSLWYRRYYATDYGTTNPFVILEIIEQDGNYYLDNEFYYDSKVANRQKEDAEYVTDTLAFIDGKRYVCNVLDPSAASFKVAAQRKGIRIKEADNDVLDGIHLMASLLALKRLKVNRQRCPMFQQEIVGYIWDKKAAERGEEKPVKTGDHAMDGGRYFCKTIVKRIPGMG
jgi:PBSX family phage terminase large subunit